MEIVIGKIRISEGQMMKKKVLVFYGLNLLITVFFALLFGGILGSIGGNEMMLGLLVVLGVQLSPFVTTMIFRKIYKQKMEYTYEFNKYSIIACVLPIFLVVISAFVLSLSGISYVKTEFKGTILIVAILITLAGAYTEEFGWRGCLLHIIETEHTPFVSSLFVGVLWGIWHFIKISSVGVVGFLLFIPTIMLFSVLMTYIFHKSNKSLVNMVVFHSFINLTNIFMIYNREGKALYVALFSVQSAVIFLIFLNDRSYFRLKTNQ